MIAHIVYKITDPFTVIYILRPACSGSGGETVMGALTMTSGNWLSMWAAHLTSSIPARTLGRRNQKNHTSVTKITARRQPSRRRDVVIILSTSLSSSWPTCNKGTPHHFGLSLRMHSMG